MQLFRLLVLVMASRVIGLFPYIDNFAHLGGLFFGLVSWVYSILSPFTLELRHFPAVPNIHLADQESADRRILLHRTPSSCLNVIIGWF